MPEPKRVLSPEKQALADARSELLTNQCPACKQPKRRGYSFCDTCYKSLPSELRRGLYQLLHESYPAAVAACKEFFYKQSAPTPPAE